MDSQASWDECDRTSFFSLSPLANLEKVVWTQRKQKNSCKVKI